MTKGTNKKSDKFTWGKGDVEIIRNPQAEQKKKEDRKK